MIYRRLMAALCMFALLACCPADAAASHPEADTLAPASPFISEDEPKAMIGEGPLTEETVGAWLKKVLHTPQIFLKPSHKDAAYGRLEPIGKDGKEEIVRTAIPKDNHYDRELLDKATKAYALMQQIIEALPNLDKKHRDKLLQDVNAAEIVVLKDHYTIAGFYYGHKAFRFGSRIYIPEKLMRRLTPRMLAMLLLEEARHGKDDRFHVHFQHDPELLRAIDVLLAEHKKEVELEQQEALRFALRERIRREITDNPYVATVQKNVPMLPELSKIKLRDDDVLVYLWRQHVVAQSGYDFRMQQLHWTHGMKIGDKELEVYVVPPAFFSKASVKPLLSVLDQMLGPIAENAMPAAMRPEHVMLWSRLERALRQAEPKEKIKSIFTKLALEMIFMPEAIDQLQPLFEKQPVPPELLMLVHEFARTPKGMMAMDLTQYKIVTPEELVEILKRLAFNTRVILDGRETTLEAAKIALAGIYYAEKTLAYAISRDHRGNRPMVTIKVVDPISPKPSITARREPIVKEPPLQAEGLVMEVGATPTPGRIGLRPQEPNVPPLDMQGITAKAQSFIGKTAVADRDDMPLSRVVTSAPGIRIIKTGKELLKEIKRPLAPEEKRVIHADEIAVSEVIRDTMREGAIGYDQKTEGLYDAALNQNDAGEEELITLGRHSDMRLRIRTKHAVQKAYDIIAAWPNDADSTIREDMKKALADARILLLKTLGGMISHAGKQFENRIYVPLPLMRQGTIDDLAQEIAGQAYHLARGDWRHEGYQHPIEASMRLAQILGYPAIQVWLHAESGKLPQGGYTDTGSSLASHPEKISHWDDLIASGLEASSGLRSIDAFCKATGEVLPRKELSVILVNIDDPNHHVNLRHALKRVSRDENVRIVLLAQRDIRYVHGTRSARDVLNECITALDFQEGKHFHAALTYDELKAMRNDGEELGQTFLRYALEKFGAWAEAKGHALEAKNIGYINSEDKTISLNVASAGILEIVPAEPSKGQALNMDTVIGFTELALRLWQAGHENISFEDLIGMLKPEQRQQMRQTIQDLGVKDFTQPGGVKAFLANPKACPVGPDLDAEIQSFKQIVSEA